MSEIPEEIRRMFPNDPIQKFDIDDNGNLLLIASAEPLVNDPLIDDPFENAPIEQVNQYLREHGYVPEQVAVNVKILVDALIENVGLHARIAVLESALEAEREKHRFIPVSERLPEEYKTYRVINDGVEVTANFESYGWILYVPGVARLFQPKLDKVTHWQPLPEPPEEGDIC